MNNRYAETEGYEHSMDGEWSSLLMPTFTSKSLPSGSEVVCIPNAFDALFCTQILENIKQAEMVFSRVSGGGRGSRLDRRVRKSAETLLPLEFVKRISSVLGRQLKYMRHALHLPLHFASRPSIVRYTAGDYFMPHQDNSLNKSEVATIRKRLATYIIYLSSSSSLTEPGDSSFCGGRFICFRDYNPLVPPNCNPRAFSIAPSQGDLIVFPSVVYHAAEPVVSGVRTCLIGWLFETNLYREAWQKRDDR